MTAMVVPAEGRDWRLLPIPEPREAERFQAILCAQLIDELTAAPPLAAARVATTTAGLIPTVSAGGRIGLLGRPASLFPEPWPGTAPVVTLAVQTRDHLPLRLARPLVAQPDMPNRLALIDLGPVALHRRPTSFSGRLVSRATGPIPAKTIRVSRHWPTFSSIAGAGTPTTALSLWAGLYADRPIGAELRRRNLTLNADLKRLEAAAAAGESTVLLSDRKNLVVNRPLAIEPDDVERAEYIGIASVDTSLSDDQPALATLDHPLRRAHPAGAKVARTSLLGAAGPANLLVRDGLEGDVSLYLDGLTGLTAANLTVLISNPGQADEYHAFSLWQAETDASGRFRLPPIHRAAHLELSGTGIGPVRVSLNAPGDALADIVVD